MGEQFEHKVATPDTPSNDGAEENGSLLGQFKDSFLHSALQTPMDGVTQIVDSTFGTDVRDKAQYFAAPEPAKFASTDWHVQQLGNAFGIAGDFLVLNKALKTGAKQLSSSSAIQESNIASGALNSFVRNPLVNGAVSGAVYDGVFRPSADDGNLLGGRLQQAGIGAATFGTLMGAGVGLRAAGRAGWLGEGALKNVASSRMGSGFLAGIPAGALSTELNTGGNASWRDIYESSYGFAFAGGAMGGGSALSSRLKAEIQAKPQPPHDPADNMIIKPGETHSAGKGVNLFLDGGGVNGFFTAGSMKAINEQNIPVDRVYANSISSMVYGLQKYGRHSPDDIYKVMEREFSDPHVRSYLPQRPGLKAFTNRADLSTLLKKWDNEYQLTPRPGETHRDDFHIGTYELGKRDLAWINGASSIEAYRASMAIPGVFSNLKFDGRELGINDKPKTRLLDGGVTHVTDKHLPRDNPLLFVRLHAPSRESTHAVNNPFLRYLERRTSDLLNRNLDAPPGDAVVVHPDKSELNSLAFVQDKQAYRALFDEGYQRTLDAIEIGRAQGMLPLKDGTYLPRTAPPAVPEKSQSDTPVPAAKPAQYVASSRELALARLLLNDPRDRTRSGA